MTGFELWLLELELECKGIDASGRLVRIPGANPDDLPLAYEATFVDGSITVYAAETKLGPDMRARRMRAYTFGSLPKVAPVDGLRRLEPEKWEVQGVSWAWSSRSNARAAELAVETEAEHRRKGYARAATAAWAREVLDAGKVAFYSHDVENHASAALAKSLGVLWFMDLVSYEA